MNYQWYPGHMTKAKRMMEENIKLIDLIIELVDARAPLSSRNPDIDSLGKGKSRMVLLGKADLANDAMNDAWVNYFKNKGITTVKLDSRKKSDLKTINASISTACAEKIERDRKKGIMNRPVRAMVVGIPNVGKSTFINTLCGKACTKTGNKPGVTKGKQWIRLNKNVELLDTPGILWPKFESEEVGKNLAFIGTINDNILDSAELSVELIKSLKASAPGTLSGRYNISEDMEVYDILNGIASARHCLKAGGELDTDKAAKILIDDFRSGKLGKITLELPGNDIG